MDTTITLVFRICKEIRTAVKQAKENKASLHHQTLCRLVNSPNPNPCTAHGRKS